MQKYLKISYLQFWEGVLVLKDQLLYLHPWFPDQSLWESVMVLMDYMVSNCEGKGLLQLVSMSPSSTWSLGSRVLVLAASSSSSPAFVEWLAARGSSLPLFLWPSWGG